MKKLKIVGLALALILAIPATAQKFMVDLSKSSITWTGKKVTGEHYGSIQLSKGWMKLADNKIAEGSFTIDMSTIVNGDLEGEMKQKLEGHLKSDDFFGVEKHPEAVLHIKGSETINATGFKLMGDLTIKGITHPIEFTGKRVDNKFIAKVIVDRSKYDVRYGSGSFFDNLGDKTIYDDFTLDVVIQAK